VPESISRMEHRERYATICIAQYRMCIANGQNLTHHGLEL
jgi:hypothetical protein